MKYLQIPTAVVVDFDFSAFCDYVLDHSPAYETRALLRLGFKAREAIEAAKGGVAEMDDAVAELFQIACDRVAVPRLVAFNKSDGGGERMPIPASAYESFYAAVEGMTAERPPDAPA